MTKKGTLEIKRGLAQMQKGGVIMDVVNPEHAKIAEDAGAVSVMALERIPSDIRKQGGVARTAPIKTIKEIMNTVSIPVMAKVRIGHYEEAYICQELEVDYIDESEVLTPADYEHHINKHEFIIPFVCGCVNLGQALRRISEGAAMIRTKGEAGTGDINQAIFHKRTTRREIGILLGYYLFEEQYQRKSYLKRVKNAVSSRRKTGLENMMSNIDSDMVIQIAGLVELGRHYHEKGLLNTHDELLKLFKNNKLPFEMIEPITKLDYNQIFDVWLDNKLPKNSLESIAREYGVSKELVRETAELRRLPVVDFAAGGIATPADAAYMMYLGSDGVFVGSGIFKSDDPEQMAKSIVKSVTHYKNPEILVEAQENIGEAMEGIEFASMSKEDLMQDRG